MIFKLGYVDGPISLPNSTFRTITYKTYKSLSKKEKNKRLTDIINNNLDNLLDFLYYYCKDSDDNQGPWEY